MERFLIIDGNSILNRAFYGIRMLQNSHGVYTNGIYGFLNILFKHLEELKPDYAAVAFDLKAPTFRHKKYSQYKAQRKGMPDELAMQMPILKELLDAMRIARYECEGYEADDIIGTVSRACEEAGVECLIVTGDKDDLQLASKTTKILLTVTKNGANETTVYDAEAVKARYGLTPAQFIDLKGLMGDSSDNVPGVKGVGEKTAASLLQAYGSVEGIYSHLDDVKGAVQKKLMADEKMAHLSKELCTILRDVPMRFSFADARVCEFDQPRLSALFKNLEFTSFLKKLNLAPDAPEKEAAAFVLCDALPKDGDFIYQLYPDAADSVFAVAYLCGSEVRCLMHPTAGQLKTAFENTAVKKISSHLKDDMVLLHRLGVEVLGDYFDISVAGYVLNPSRSGYETSDLAAEFLGEPIKSLKEALGTGRNKKTLSDLSDDALGQLICGEVSAIAALYPYEQEKIAETRQEKLLYDIELPLVSVLAGMEIAGFFVDKAQLIAFGEMLSRDILRLEEEIYELAGEPFNIGSTKQLGAVLFDKLCLPVYKKTKTGYSTDADVLERLSGYHPIVGKVLEYRKLTKLKSTYADGLLSVISPADGKIHSRFHQTVTTTGRISSTEPNLQNIPMRQDLGREIRKMFVVSDENNVLIDADYSQIELRILAHISGDQSMIAAFANHEDIHATTATKVFGVSADELTPLLRSRAKAINFGIVYGMGDFSLAHDLGIPKKEAKSYIDGYFSKYPDVKRYMTEIVETGRRQGYVETLLGRRRYLPELNSKNFVARSAGERMAMNTPIQGTAADIIKIAMVRVCRALKEGGYQAKLILQVHDELIIEAPKEEQEAVTKLLIDCMQGAYPLNVPLVASAGTGKTWFDAH